MPNLFLNLCDQPLPAVNGLVSHVSKGPLLKSPYRLRASGCNTLPSIGAHFLFMFSMHRLNAFSMLTKHLSHTVAMTFAV